MEKFSLKKNRFLIDSTGNEAKPKGVMKLTLLILQLFFPFIFAAKEKVILEIID